MRLPERAARNTLHRLRCRKKNRASTLRKMGKEARAQKASLTPPSRLPLMLPDPKHQAARKKVRTAQKQFERESSAASKLRRKAFAQAQKEGLSLRQIGEEIGLTHSRVAQIINGK